jgi:hypothetical protein
MTAGGAYGALLSAASVIASLAGYTIRNPPGEWTLLWLTLPIPILLTVARIVHRDEWQQWKQHMSGMSLRDMLRFRHIPDLQQPTTPPSR